LVDADRQKENADYVANIPDRFRAFLESRKPEEDVASKKHIAKSAAWQLVGDALNHIANIATTSAGGDHQTRDYSANYKRLDDRQQKLADDYRRQFEMWQSVDWAAAKSFEDYKRQLLDLLNREQSSSSQGDSTNFRTGVSQKRGESNRTTSGTQVSTPGELEKKLMEARIEAMKNGGLNGLGGLSGLGGLNGFGTQPSATGGAITRQLTENGKVYNVTFDSSGKEISRVEIPTR
jgi:hypothetical protein